MLRTRGVGPLSEDYSDTGNLMTAPSPQLTTSPHITDAQDLQYQTFTADSRTSDYSIFLRCFHHFLISLPGMLDFTYCEPADTSFQSIGIHLWFYMASSGIIRILDYSPPFVP